MYSKWRLVINHCEWGKFFLFKYLIAVNNMLKISILQILPK